jgi:murein DD-endopeptidase MepM/ murein hydrolase activator NlpD
MLFCPLRAPLRVTQHFGQNRKDYQQYGLDGHDGTDLTGPVAGASDPVFAPCDGIVLLTEHLPGFAAYGKGVLIRSTPDKLGRSREVILGHHSSLAVADGQSIHQGDRVGMTGQTGAARGVHCHLGLRFRLPDGSVENFGNGFHGFVDPEPYLRYWLDHPEIDPFLHYPNG